MSSGKILVIRGGAIGDFILTLPVLQAIRDTYPIAKLEVLGYPHIARLATLGGLADAAHPIEAQAVAGFFARNGSLNEDWMDYFAQFEIIISFLYDPDKIFQTNIGRCSEAQFIEGPHRPDETDTIHAARAFLKPLEQMAIFDTEGIPRLPIEPDPSRSLPPGSWLVLHPGSGSKSKNWPIESWNELAGLLLTESQWNLLIVGGEAERHELDQLKSLSPADRVRFELCRPLDELASLIASAEGFVGHDSGISHLAAALNLPGLILWGPSNQTVWRPRSERVVVIDHAEGLSSLPVEQVWARIPDPGPSA